MRSRLLWPRRPTRECKTWRGCRTTTVSSRNGTRPGRVAFDTLALNARFQHHGIQVYSRHLLNAFRQIGPGHSMQIRPFVSAASQGVGSELEEAPGFCPSKASLLRFDRLWRYGGAAATAFIDGADVLFNPAGTSLPIKGMVPTVTTIHDLTPVVMPLFTNRIAALLKFQLRWAARFSAAIVTVSESSRN